MTNISCCDAYGGKLRNDNSYHNILNLLPALTSDRNFIFPASDIYAAIAVPSQYIKAYSDRSSIKIE
ncbi:hypothetical protein [Nostoc sp. C110]|uniref:hypothetical protein n=1 Tax=Nostoc sp. C110 TaxID=3349876 RepID=UPI00370D38A1